MSDIDMAAPVADTTAGPRRASAAPGKRTRTQALPARTTGIPILDQGALCETDPPPGADCGLTPQERRDTRADLAQVTLTAYGNMSAACEDERIKKLLKKNVVLGPWGALLLTSGSGLVIGAIAGALEAVAAYAQYAKPVKAWLSFGAKPLVSRFQDAANKSDQDPRVRFIELVRETIKPLADLIFQESLVRNDDGELIALVNAYRDSTFHSVAAYRAMLHGLLERFDAFHMGDIGEAGPRAQDGVLSFFQEGTGGAAHGFMPVGPSPEFLKGELAVVSFHGQAWMTLLEQRGLREENPLRWRSPHQRDLVPVLQDGRALLIPEDLQGFAATLYAEKTGRTPQRIDLDAVGGQVPDAIGKIVGGSYIDRMFLGMGGRS